MPPTRSGVSSSNRQKCALWTANRNPSIASICCAHAGWYAQDDRTLTVRSVGCFKTCRKAVYLRTVSTIPANVVVRNATTSERLMSTRDYVRGGDTVILPAAQPLTIDQICGSWRMPRGPRLASILTFPSSGSRNVSSTSAARTV
jgi:hypothetical protein